MSTNKKEKREYRIILQNTTDGKDAFRLVLDTKAKSTLGAKQIATKWAKKVRPDLVFQNDWFFALPRSPFWENVYLKSSVNKDPNEVREEYLMNLPQLQIRDIESGRERREAW